MSATTDTNIAPAAKRTVRRKSSVAASSSSDTSSTNLPVVSMKSLNTIISAFSELSNKIIESRNEFESLQKEIGQTRELWMKEQKDHESQVREAKKQEEIEKRREQETYSYETNLIRKKAEDEFAEKKARWEKELAERKEELEKDKRELIELRKQVAGFEIEKERGVKEACLVLQKELTERFTIEKKLREQEVQGEKEILSLRIDGLTLENTRQSKEIAALKSALDEATRQLKEIAVKVIESASPSPKIQTSSE